MRSSIFHSIFIPMLVFCFSSLESYDLTVVGPVIQADGLGRISVGVIDLLKNDLKINCITAQYASANDISDEVNAIVQNPDKSPGTVSILFAPLWYANHSSGYTLMPKSKIRIAYSMLESTKIPSQWTKILNSSFDAVVVPDQFLVEVYKNSGVKIPIFVLPIGMYLDEYFAMPKSDSLHVPFVFGTTVSCDERKNYNLLIRAFAEEFGNSNEVVLRLNSRAKSDAFHNLIQQLGVSNIILTDSPLNKSAFLDFMRSFDCFVNISKGEGFSLCPREALALGIPCIITKNTAQITICDSGLVREVPSLIPEPATYWGLFGDQQVGYFLTCSKDDVKAALRDVYINYSFYQKKAKAGPEWVSQYSWRNLKAKYLSLIKPKKVVLGNRNEITDDYLMTNSSTLYKKYKKALAGKSKKKK